MQPDQLRAVLNDARERMPTDPGQTVQEWSAWQEGRDATVAFVERRAAAQAPVSPSLPDSGETEAELVERLSAALQAVYNYGGRKADQAREIIAMVREHDAAREAGR